MINSRVNRTSRLMTAVWSHRFAGEAVLLVFVFLFLGNWRLLAQNYGPPLDPYEVIVYENVDFVGDCQRYKLEPGMRQKLVPVLPEAWNDRISSVRVGEKVGVQFFENADFGYTLREANKEWGSAILFESQKVLLDDYNDAISSLIVFPKGNESISGAWLIDASDPIWVYHYRFYPLPEWSNQKEAKYPVLSGMNDDANRVFFDSANFYPQQIFGPEKVEVILYENSDFSGRELTLPGSDGKVPDPRYVWWNLGDYQFSDTASSLIVRVRKPAAPLDPNEVIVYEHYNFMGMSKRFKLEPGLRQKLVNYVGDDLNDRISSIQVGSKVGVAGFDHADYGGAEVYCTESRDRLSDARNDMISSLIVFPREYLTPVGVRLVDARDEGKDFWFYPVPEKLTENEARYSVLGGMENDANQVWFLPGTASKSPVAGKVGVTLWEHADFKGRWITFPSADNEIPREGWLTLNHYSFDDAASSLVVRWLGPTMTVMSTAIVQADVPNEAQVIVPGGGSQTSQEHKNRSGIPLTVQNTGAPDLTGQWKSSVGAVYQIQQSGNQFTWQVAASGEKGQGAIQGKTISASWKGPAGSGSAQGKITALGDAGEPIRIEWDNGVQFFR